MRTLFYLAPVYIHPSRPDGVGKKVLNHYRTLAAHYDCCVAFYGDDGVIFRSKAGDRIVPYQGRHRRYALYEEAARYMQEMPPERIYIRYPRCEQRFIQLLKVMKAAGARIVTEIPTYPYELNLTAGPRAFAMGLSDLFFRQQMKRYVGRIVTFSQDDEIYGIQTIRTINGVIFDQIAPCCKPVREGRIQMISVATNYDCHGFDRLITGMEQYYAGGGTQELRFHIVGDGPAIESYRKQLAQCRYLHERVFIHGFKSGAELESLYQQADIAVNSLAIHRIGLVIESTLKSKEYAAKGLPMLSSSVIDAFSEADNARYVLRVPANDDPIDMRTVIDFYHRMYDTEPETVAVRIRHAAESVCDLSVTMQPVIDYFEKT